MLALNPFLTTPAVSDSFHTHLVILLRSWEIMGIKILFIMFV